jgi:hypothetical protein
VSEERPSPGSSAFFGIDRMTNALRAFSTEERPFMMVVVCAYLAAAYTKAVLSCLAFGLAFAALLVAWSAWKSILGANRKQ